MSGWKGFLSGLGRGVLILLKLGVAAAAAAAILAAVWRLESSTTGVHVEETRVYSVPVRVYTPERLVGPGEIPEAGKVPVVAIAHGFAGSQELMQPYAVTLARNGYIAATFDFPGHGKNTNPFVASLEDTEKRIGLLSGALETAIGYADGLPGANGRLALLGHSMAGDVLARYAAEHPERVAATVLVSPYLSPEAPLDTPNNLLVVYGELEPPMLHTMGQRAIAEAAGVATPSEVEPGRLYGAFDQGTARKLVLAKGAEHIGVLFGPSGLAAALDWLNRTFDDTGSGYLDDRGLTLGLLFVALLILVWPLASLLPRAATVPMGSGLRWGRLAPVALLPAVLTPLILRFVPTDYLPILLGDYLALHFGLYGLLTAVLIVFFSWGRNRERSRENRRALAARAAGGAGSAETGGPLVPWVQHRTLWGGFLLATLLASAYAVFAIAVPMDRYVTAFLPGPERLAVVAALLPGTWLYFAADGWLVRGGAPPLARVVTKVLFLLSLVLAVVLNLEQLFFLLIIIPAILVFFVFYGVMAGWVYRRTWHPLVGATAIGFAIAWGIGSTFPIVGA